MNKILLGFFFFCHESYRSAKILVDLHLWWMFFCHQIKIIKIKWEILWSLLHIKLVDLLACRSFFDIEGLFNLFDNLLVNSLVTVDQTII